VTNENVEGLSRDAITGHSYLPAECPRTARLLIPMRWACQTRRRQRPARDAAYALERDRERMTLLADL